MKIYTWNINGYNTCDQYGTYTRILNDAPDIFCLQEVKIADPDRLNTIFTMQYEQFHNFSQNKGHNGVFVFSKKRPERVEYGIGFDRFDKDGRFLFLEYSDFVLVNVYMPHGGRDKRDMCYKMEAYDRLYAFVSRFDKKEKPLIIVGDFNIAHTYFDLERYKDNANNTMYTLEERGIFDRILELNLQDVYRSKYPKKRAYTWWPYAYNARERNMGWRIDYILSTKDYIVIKNIKIHKDLLGSDHCPVSMTFEIIR